ncbi:MAG TPA: hypothetical protein VGM01_00075 [Ktedonobacteraceae bacterium]|jgi:hypothetical protein
MEKGRARRFQPATTAFEQSWNVVELTTRKQVRQKINELLRQCSDSSVTTSKMRQELLQGVAAFGNHFATQLVRSLHRDDDAERQSIIWLLTVLNACETIPPLQQMAANKHLPRTIRLAASLALAGMGVTAQTIEKNRRVYLYAIS